MDRNFGGSIETQSHAPVLALDYRDFDDAIKAFRSSDQSVSARGKEHAPRGAPQARPTAGGVAGHDSPAQRYLRTVERYCR